MAQPSYRKDKPACSGRAACRTFAVILIALTVLTPLEAVAGGSREGETYYVSLLSLLTDPENLEGSVVRAMGFLKYDGQLTLIRNTFRGYAASGRVFKILRIRSWVSGAAARRSSARPWGRASFAGRLSTS